MKQKKFICVLFCLGICLSATAQINIIPREKLEMMANPRHSADSSWLQFQTKSLVAEPMKDNCEPVMFDYHMTNVGPETLTIKRMVTTCPCAQVHCDKTVIAPSESTVITVTYDPEGHPGKFERRVFIYTQDGPYPAAVLKLAVTVERSDRFKDLYKYPLGNIRLRRPEVTFRSNGKQIERIPFVNVSGRTLQLQCIEEMLPECIDFAVEPSVVEDQKEGEIIISFDPDKGHVRSSMPIIIKDTGVSPSRSSIIVKILNN